MKKSILSLAVIMTAALSISSCGGKEKEEEKKAVWSEGERKIYLESCEKSAANSLGAEKAKEYCNCTLEKMEAKYPDSKDVSKVTAEEINQMAEECMQ